MRWTRLHWALSAVALLAVLTTSIARAAEDMTPVKEGQNEPKVPTTKIDDDSPAVGVAVLEVDVTVRDSFKKDGIPNPPKMGVLVAGVAAGSPAQVSGIRKLDLLELRDGAQTVVTPQQFSEWMAKQEVGQPVPFAIWRPEALDVKQGPKFRWTRRVVNVTPVTRRQMQRTMLRFSYIRIDGQWHKLPDFDLTRPSSQDRPFDPGNNRYFRGPNGTTMSTTYPARRPPGWRDVTREVNQQKQKEWEEQIPRFKVGEFGVIPSDYNTVRVRQVAGKRALLVEIDRMGTTNDIDMWLDGFDTEGLTDGVAMKGPLAIAIVGSKTYTTVLGANKTVLLAVPLNVVRRGLSDKEIEALEKHLATSASN